METNSPLELANLMSISGITVVTMFLIEVLKRVFAKNETFGKIPAFVYAAVISVGLAFFANRVLKTEDGSPFLEGSTQKVLWAALLSALSSSGFYSWVREPNQLRNTGRLFVRKITPLLLLFVVVGCQCPEKPIIVNSPDQGTKTIREQHKDWLEKLGDDPAKRAELPTLTPVQQENLRQLHKDLDDTIAEYKAEGMN